MTDQDQIRPWSETRSKNPVELPPGLAEKNKREIDPRISAKLYYEFYDGNADQVTVKDKSGKTSSYELVANINDPDSSSHIKIVKNSETDHYIMLVKGMDLPVIRNEGGGYVAGFANDIAELGAAKFKACISDQVIHGEKAYLKLLQNPDVKSIEMVGYSIGSLPASYAASVYGAQITNIADLGIPGTGSLGAAKKFVSENFSLCAHGLFPGASGKFEENLNNNTIGLELRADIMGGKLGGTGKLFGKQDILDENNFRLSGAAHIPKVYGEAIAEKYADAPTAETTVKSSRDTWKPF